MVIYEVDGCIPAVVLHSTVYRTDDLLHKPYISRKDLSFSYDHTHWSMGMYDEAVESNLTTVFATVAFLERWIFSFRERVPRTYRLRPQASRFVGFSHTTPNLTYTRWLLRYSQSFIRWHLAQIPRFVTVCTFEDVNFSTEVHGTQLHIHQQMSNGLVFFATKLSARVSLPSRTKLRPMGHS